MKKRAFILMLISLCFVASCAETVDQDNSKTRKKKSFKGFPVEIKMKKAETFPVELQLPEGKSIPVKIETKEKDGLDVKVHWQENSGQPIKVDLQSDKSFPVDVKLQTGDGIAVKLNLQGYNLPVELKTNPDEPFAVKLQQPRIIIAAVVAIIAIVVLAASIAFFAWRAAYNSKLTAQMVLKILEEKSKS